MALLVATWRWLKDLPNEGRSKATLCGPLVVTYPVVIADVLRKVGRAMSRREATSSALGMSLGDTFNDQCVTRRGRTMTDVSKVCSGPH